MTNTTEHFLELAGYPTVDICQYTAHAYHANIDYMYVVIIYIPLWSEPNDISNHI